MTIRGRINADVAAHRRRANQVRLVPGDTPSRFDTKGHNERVAAEKAKKRADADKWFAERFGVRAGVPVRTGLHEGMRAKGPEDES